MYVHVGFFTNQIRLLLESSHTDRQLINHFVLLAHGHAHFGLLWLQRRLLSGRFGRGRYSGGTQITFIAIAIAR
jgi:hypothetical protein